MFSSPSYDQIQLLPEVLEPYSFLHCVATVAATSLWLDPPVNIKVLSDFLDRVQKNTIFTSIFRLETLFLWALLGKQLIKSGLEIIFRALLLCEVFSKGRLISKSIVTLGFFLYEKRSFHFKNMKEYKTDMEKVISPKGAKPN